MFCGDGEMDEPESLGAISLAGREKLDNLIFVINCNLQKLDGPVRGNGKIIQELEGDFRGAGWNVIKLRLGLRLGRTARQRHHRPPTPAHGRVRRRRIPGLQGPRRRLHPRKLLRPLSRDSGHGRRLAGRENLELTRGGHDPVKIYAAYKAAVEHKGKPTVILAKTVKGYGMGEAGEGQMIAHQAKKMGEQALERLPRPLQHPDCRRTAEELPFIKFAEGQEEMKYLRERRKALGGLFRTRRAKVTRARRAAAFEFEAQLKSSGEREISTTMAFVHMLTKLMRDKSLGKRIVPIVPDESRTFGMEGMFRQFGIFSQVGQLYRPQDAEQLMYYKEDKNGQVLEEGINEAGAMSAWIAAAHLVLGVEPADDPVLRLLLDVRLPAHR